MRLTLLSLALLPLLGLFIAGPGACDEKKAEKVSDLDLANLKLAASQMDVANQSFALAKRAMDDSQRDYAEAKKRRDALLNKYHVTPDDKTVTIGDDGAITRAPPPAPVKKK